jgi:hypothetical protein
MALLLALLVVAYGGSMLMGGRTLRGHGLPSGSEWLVLGFVLGPLLLGVVSQSALSALEPVAGIATAWLALLAGLECGGVDAPKLRVGPWLAGVGCALVCAALVGLALFVLTTRVLHWPVMQAASLATALGLAGSETARQAARWAVERSAAHGPLPRLLEQLAAADDLVPYLGLAWLFAWTPGLGASVGLGAAQGFALTLGLGALLGLTCAMLLRTTRSPSDGFGVVLGAALLGTGVAFRLWLCPLTVMFVMGVLLAVAGRRATRLQALLASTEPAVALPTLLLAGALVRPPLSWSLLVLCVVTVLARGLVRAALGWLLASASGAPRGARAPFALGSSATGALTPIIGLACAFRFRGSLGDSILAVCACVTLVGEIVGPAALRRALAVGVPADALPSEPALLPGGQP